MDLTQGDFCLKLMNHKFLRNNIDRQPPKALFNVYNENLNNYLSGPMNKICIILHPNANMYSFIFSGSDLIQFPELVSLWRVGILNERKTESLL